MRVDLKGVMAIKKTLSNGTRRTYYYLRGLGALKPLKPLPGDEGKVFRPGTIAFMRAYNATVIKPPQPTGLRPRPEVLSSLLADYRASPKFKRLGVRTRSDYLKHMTRIEDKFGTLPVGALEEKKVRPLFLRWRDELAERSPRQADMTLSVLSVILNWAVDQGRIGLNYAAKPGRTYSVDRSAKIWLSRHLEAFTLQASPQMRLALTFALHTGQRQGDLLELRWKHVADGRLRFRQSKKGRTIDIPLTGRLRSALDEARRRGHNVGSEDHILVSSAERKWTGDGFRNAWAKTVERAGFGGEDLHFHDLRGTTCTLLAEAGCDDTTIAAILGWKLDTVAQMRNRYQAIRSTASDVGIEKLEKVLEDQAGSAVH